MHPQDPISPATELTTPRPAPCVVAPSPWLWLPAFAALGILCLALCWREEVDPDVHFHLLAGELTLDRGAPVTENLFTHPHQGRSFINHEWLFQLILAAFHRLVGAAGVGLLKALAILGTFSLLALPALRRAGAPITAWLLLPILLLASGRFHARPEVLSLLCLAAALAISERLMAGVSIAGDAERSAGRRGVVALGLLAVVWANLHGFAAMLPGLLLLMALARAVADGAAWRRGRARWLGLASAATLVAGCLTPAGLQGAIHPWRLALAAFGWGGEEAQAPGLGAGLAGLGGHLAAGGVVLGEEARLIAGSGPVMGRIVELASPIQAVASGSWDSQLLMVAMALVALAVPFLAWRGRLQAERLAMAGVGMVLGFSALRNVAFAAVLLFPLLVDALTLAVESGFRPSSSPRLASQRRWLAAGVAAGLLVVVALGLTRLALVSGLHEVVGFRLSPSIAAGDALAYHRAAAFLERERPAGNLFNNFGAGHWLARRFVPSGGPLPFVCPHTDLYPSAHLAEYHAVIDGVVPMDRLVARHGVGVILLDHRIEVSHTLIETLVRDPSWALVHVDERALILVLTSLPKNAKIAARLALRPADLAQQLEDRFEFAGEQPGYGIAWLDALARWGVVAQRPPAPVDRVGVASLLLQLGQAEVARREADRALALAPNMATARYVLGSALRALGEVDAAASELTSVLRAYPASLNVLLALASIEIGRAGADPRHLARAEAWLQRARSVSPRDPAVRVNLMVVAAMRGDLEKFEALEAEGALPFRLRRAALLNRGLLLESRGDRSGARAVYRQVADRFPAHPEAHNRLGNMDFQGGFEDLAASGYEAALRADPDHVDALYNLGVVRFDQGRYAEAVALWEAVLRNRPGHPQARRHLVAARRRAFRSGGSGGKALKSEPR